MQPPLFILSPPRSFTTLVCAMLGNHPEMCGLAETNLFLADRLGGLAKLYRIRPSFRHGLLRSVSELALKDQSAESVEAVKEWLDDHASMPTAELFGVLGDWAGERSLIDKSPFHVFSEESLRRMADSFPDAYYLHLTRHPVAMWRSLERTRERTADVSGKLNRFFQWSPKTDREDLDTEQAWLRPHLQILEFLDSVPTDHQIRVRGEALLSDPAAQVARLCAWLGKRDDPEAIEAMLHPERSPFACFGPPNARLGNDPDFMSHPELRPFNERPIPLDGVADDGQGLPLSDSVRHYARVFGY